MANTAKALFRGAATTTLTTTLYTVPSSTSTVVTNIVVTNTAGTSATFDLALDGVKLHSGTTLAANSSAYLDIKQVLATGKIIAGGASATTVNFHISGMEIA
jgi:hypothetical protein